MGCLGCDSCPGEYLTDLAQQTADQHQLSWFVANGACVARRVTAAAHWTGSNRTCYWSRRSHANTHHTRTLAQTVNLFIILTGLTLKPAVIGVQKCCFSTLYNYEKRWRVTVTLGRPLIPFQREQLSLAGILSDGAYEYSAQREDTRKKTVHIH